MRRFATGLTLAVGGLWAIVAPLDAQVRRPNPSEQRPVLAKPAPTGITLTPVAATARDAPQIVAASASAPTVATLAWKPVEHATGYLVVRRGIQITPVPIAATSYSDAVLLGGSGYSYNVGAVFPDTVVWSAVVTLSTPWPAPPGELRYNKHGDSPIQWDQVPGANGYLVWRNGAPFARVRGARLPARDTLPTEYRVASTQDPSAPGRHDFSDFDGMLGMLPSVTAPNQPVQDNSGFGGIAGGIGAWYWSMMDALKKGLDYGAAASFNWAKHNDPLAYHQSLRIEDFSAKIAVPPAPHSGATVTLTWTTKPSTAYQIARFGSPYGPPSWQYVTGEEPVPGSDLVRSYSYTFWLPKEAQWCYVIRPFEFDPEFSTPTATVHLVVPQSGTVVVASSPSIAGKEGCS